MSDSDQDLRNGDLLRLDLVSISSNSLSGSIAEISSHETRRNSMRLFWDALARRSLRRNIHSPTIVFATGVADDLGSHDRWILDFSGDLHYYGSGRDIDSFSVGLHRRHERGWSLRSEVSLFSCLLNLLSFLFYEFQDDILVVSLFFFSSLF